MLRTFQQSVMRKCLCQRWPGLPYATLWMWRIPWADIDYRWLMNVEAPLRPAKRGLDVVWQGGDSILYRIDATS